MKLLENSLNKYRKKVYKKQQMNALWLIIIEIMEELVIIFETDTEIIMEKIIADNQVIKKYLNLQSYINAA